jgi:hypothetical protein
VAFFESGDEPPAGSVEVVFFASADRHHVAHVDALHVMNNAHSVLVLREDPLKLLWVGFDSQGRPREVVTDKPDTPGPMVVIHADTLTPSYHEFL